MLSKIRSIFTFGGGFLLGAWIVFMGFFAYLQISDAQVEYDASLLSRPQDLIYDFDSWKTYENVTQDYEFQYPVNWYAQDFTLFVGSNAVISDTAVPPNARLPESPLEVNKGFILDVFIRKTEGQLDPEKWMKDNLKTFDPEASIAEMQKIEVAGENARLVTLEVEGTDSIKSNARNSYELVVLPYKNDTYLIRLFTGAKEGKDYEPVFMHLLETFTFKDEVVNEPWTKYVNKNLNYSFEYPVDWEIDEGKNNAVRVWKEFAPDNTTENLKERAEFYVRTHSFPNGSNLESWINTYDKYKERGLRLIDQDNIPFVKWVHGIKRYYGKPDEPGRFVTLFIPYNNKIYWIEYNFVFDPGRVKRKATYERILYDILNTLDIK
ncbi:hypothetical protein ACFL1U_01450 [Patescibacteria group bacterium]